MAALVVLLMVEAVVVVKQMKMLGQLTKPLAVILVILQNALVADQGEDLKSDL